MCARSQAVLTRATRENAGVIEQAIVAGDSGGFFAGQMSGRAQQIHRGQWSEHIRRGAKAGMWSPAVIAALMIWWPDARSMWEREYRALPVLGSLSVQGLTIHEFMAEEPNFFMDVLCEGYLPAHRDASEQAEPTAEARREPKQHIRSCWAWGDSRANAKGRT